MLPCKAKKNQSMPHKNISAVAGLKFTGVLLVGIFTTVCAATASGHYTEKQLAALAERVGRTFWIQEVKGRTPSFFAAPNAKAALFDTRAGESFEIVELVGRSNKNPFYKARFDSGKEGYFPPEVMLEEFNLTIVTVDPLAQAKREEAEQAEVERQRVQWINAQPWPAATKLAALKGRAVPGMTYDEVKKIAGEPGRITKVQAPGVTPEEHWTYPDGRQFVFHNGLLTRVIPKDAKKP